LNKVSVGAIHESSEGLPLGRDIHEYPPQIVKGKNHERAGTGGIPYRGEEVKLMTLFYFILYLKDCF
jgi:hypothetical protein